MPAPAHIRDCHTADDLRAWASVAPHWSRGTEDLARTILRRAEALGVDPGPALAMAECSGFAPLTEEQRAALDVERPAAWEQCACRGCARCAEEHGCSRRPVGTWAVCRECGVAR